MTFTGPEGSSAWRHFLSGRTGKSVGGQRLWQHPVVFIHGLWLLPNSWANWADFFKQAGYADTTADAPCLR